MRRTLSVVTPAANRALVKIDTIKTELGLAGATEDTWLTSAVLQACDALAGYCGRPEGFAKEVVTDTWRAGWAADSTSALMLSRDLVPSITSIAEDGVSLAGTDWLLDGMMLRRLRDDRFSLWCATKIVATYDAGFTVPAGNVTGNVPENLQRCCIDLVVRAYRGRGRDGGMRSERVLDIIQRSWDTPGGDGFKRGLPRDIAERVEPYERWVVA